MTGKIVKCPICENDAVVSKHLSFSPSIGDSVPCYIYTCETDGWFKLSESVNSLVTNNRAPDVVEKLSRKVAENYLPEDLTPAELITPLILIEALE